MSISKFAGMITFVGILTFLWVWSQNRQEVETTQQ